MVKILKLTTGEDIVSAVAENEKAGFYTLKNPFRLVATQQGLGLVPLCPLAKSEDFEINSIHVVWEAEPEDEIKNAYAESTGSIVVPTPSLIV